MNSVDLERKKLEKIECLKKYGLDQESIEFFKNKIKLASDIDKQKYGQELLMIISNKQYDEDVDFDRVVELILLGADIECRSEKKGNFPLLICSIRNYLKTFIVLLKSGANINQTNNYGTTPTMSCARHGNEEMLDIAILMGADINKRSSDGDNAIASAIMHNQKRCFDMLVNNQSYLNNRNILNKTLLDIESKEYSEIHSMSKSLGQNIRDKVTCEDAENLLTDATERMQKINKLIR